MMSMQKGSLSKLIATYLKANMLKPFKWGEHDCCTFACDIIKIKHGVDHCEHVRGSYQTPSAAKRVLVKHFGSMSKGFSNVITEKDPRFLQSCDLALLDTSNGKTMALFYGGSFWAVGERGMVTLSGNNPILKAWEI